MNPKNKNARTIWERAERWRVIYKGNCELAIKYYLEASRDVKDAEMYAPAARIIAESEIDLKEYYQIHKGLNGVNIKGIGPNRRADLDRILKNESKKGAETA